jgi:hypothetical protein
MRVPAERRSCVANRCELGWSDRRDGNAYFASLDLVRVRLE